MVPLNKILSAPLKQTPSAMVRVYEDYVDVKDPRTKQTKASLRVICYLEDNGVTKARPTNSLQQARDLNRNPATAGVTQADGQIDYQAVWQLEMWKRAEEAKFKAYLKQREIEKIEDITSTWRQKESDREHSFNDSMRSIE